MSTSQKAVGFACYDGDAAVSPEQMFHCQAVFHVQSAKVDFD